MHKIENTLSFRNNLWFSILVLKNCNCQYIIAFKLSQSLLSLEEKNNDTIALIYLYQMWSVITNKELL